MNAEPSADKRPLLRASRGFARLWLAQCLGTVAYRMFHMALLWATVEMGARWDASSTRAPPQDLGTFPGTGTSTDTFVLGSGLRLAFLLLASALPAVLLARWVGRRVEQGSAPRTMALALIGIGIIAFSATAAATFPGLAEAITERGYWALQFAALVVAALVSAVVQSPFEPALGKGIGRTVEKSRLPEAVAWQTSTQSLANFGGAVAGASLIAALTVPGVFAAAGALALAGAALLLFPSTGREPAGSLARTGNPGTIDGAEMAREPQPSVSRSADDRPLRDIYVHEMRLLAGFGCVNFFATPLLVLLPLLVKSDYGGQASLLGWLEGAMWIGLLAGSVLAGRRAGRFNPLRVPFPAVLTMGLALAGGVAGAHHAHVAAHACGLLVFGLALGLNNTAMLGHFQLAVADADKGRFFAAMQAVVSATFPLGYLVFGAAADVFGARGASYVQGAGLSACAFLFLVLATRARRLRSEGSTSGATGEEPV